MIPQRPSSPEQHRAFSRAFADEIIGPATLRFLQTRVTELDRLSERAARAALLNDDARAGALILEGQLREARSWLDVVKRYLETDGESPSPSPTP